MTNEYDKNSKKIPVYLFALFFNDLLKRYGNKCQENEFSTLTTYLPQKYKAIWMRSTILQKRIHVYHIMVSLCKSYKNYYLNTLLKLRN